MADEKPMHLVPVPDPTVLTTEQLQREIAALKEILTTRLNGMDRAQQLLREDMTRVPNDAEKQVTHLRELCEEKFHSIEVQFRERDTRTEQTSKDSKVAVDAALQAAKEAVGEQNKSSSLAIAKSEAATTKQIDQLGTIIETTTKGLDDKIVDIKERLTLIEGRTIGAETITKKTTDNLGVIIAIALLFVAVLAIAIPLLLKH